MLTPTTVRRSKRVLAAFAVAAGVATHLVLQAGMMLSWTGWNLSAFRNYYWTGQLAYLAIVTDVSHGKSAFVEPFTLTGSDYYPRGYYIAIGTLARVTSTHPSTVWTLCGLAAQVLLVVAIGVTCVLLTRRWWTGVLGFVPFVIGTGSWLLDRHSWMTLLDSHAVLWGGFGVFYTLNGESVALSLGATAMLALLLVGAGRVPTKLVWPVSISACMVIGLLANIQTYAFLVSVFMVAGCAAVAGLVRARSWRAAALSLALVGVVFLAGPPLAKSVSPLAALVAGLVPALPGLLLLARGTGRRLWWCLLAVSVGASPQVLATVIGLLGHDDFLVYRESSSKNLGVPLASGLWAAAWILPSLVLTTWAGIRQRRLLWTAVPVGVVAVWTILAANDRWGANQEPYRFWLDSYSIVLILAVPLLVWVVTTGFTRACKAAAPAKDQVAPERAWSGRARAALAAGLVVSLAAAGVSVTDFIAFRRSVTEWAYVPLATPRYQAAADLASLTDGGLVLADACIDPQIFKIAWGGPVVFYHPGLAWPTHVDDIRTLLSSRDSGQLDMAAARRADVRWVLLDPTCTVDIRPSIDGQRVRAASYSENGQIVSDHLELWRLND